MIDPILLNIILFFVGIIAGTIDSIAGGGGLITLPALLGLGYSPHLALGTNKFQSTFGSLTASVHYVHKGIVDLKQAITGVIFTTLGTVMGAWAVQQIKIEILSTIIPFLLGAIIIYSLVTPKLGEIDKHAKLNESIFYFLFGILFGFYDGFFGPGVGSFWAFAFVIFLGFNLQKATGYTKVMNFTSNIVSLIIFIIGGNVVFISGLVMGLGQIIGARIGSGLVIKKGAKFVRPVFITIVVLTTLKLIYDRIF